MDRTRLQARTKASETAEKSRKQRFFGVFQFGRVLAGFWQTPFNPWQGFGRTIYFTF